MREKVTLEQRIKRIEDIEEIRNLKALYCTNADIGWEGAGASGDKFAALFTEDAVWDSGAWGVRAEGRENIGRLVTRIKFGIHCVMNPVIKIDGDKATGLWYALVSMTTLDGKAVKVAGKYDEEYVRTSEGWRIKCMKFHAAYTTPYEDGWAKTQFLQNRFGAHA